MQHKKIGGRCGLIGASPISTSMMVPMFSGADRE